VSIEASRGSISLRIESLDILRAFAVLLVIGHHAAFRFAPAANDPIGRILKECGWIGVDLFFVVSGFLIAKVLLRDGTDIQGFFRRRAMRILPLLLMAVALYAGLSAASGIGADALKNIWSPALLMNGWTIPLIGYAVIPYTITWSLSVEEAAYGALGVVSYLCGGNGMRWLLLALVAGALATRALIVEFELMSMTLAYYFVPARVDTIGLGGLAALGMFKAIEGSRTAAILTGTAMVLVIAALVHFPRDDPFMARYGYTIFGFVVAAFVACLAAESGRTARSGSAWPRRLAVRFGRYSYFIYLFHMFVLEALLIGQGVLPRSLSFWEALLITSGITFGMSAVSWRYFEHPLIVRSRWPMFRKLGPANSTAA
jgi:peptidoglycan/LPS O-acetylase OafA/YrhL